MALSTEMRRQMCHQCRNSRKRRRDFSPSQPTEWAPTTIISPDSGLPFSDEMAWRLIGDLLEDGKEFTEIVLDKPPGVKAYWTKHELSDGKVIYIKIQPGGNIVWCRSFHIDRPPS